MSMSQYASKEDLLQSAIRDLIERFHLGDFVYDIKERADTSEMSDGSIWEHPDVVRFSECVEILKASLLVESGDD